MARIARSVAAGLLGLGFATGCGCGDRVLSRSITIIERRGADPGAWGPIEVDTSQVPDAEVARTERTDECGHPTTALWLSPDRPIKIMIVPATPREESERRNVQN